MEISGKQKGKMNGMNKKSEWMQWKGTMSQATGMRDESLRRNDKTTALLEKWFEQARFGLP
jgi:hypothetical protein